MSDGITSVDEDKYPGGWGTILVAGMRMGGAAMHVDIDKTDGNAFNEDIDRTVSSAYVIMDITDPESPPGVLAEISLPGQGFTTCLPAIMPMGRPNAESRDANKWYLIFGSGPADAAGRADRGKLMHESSDQAGKLFVLDLCALYAENRQNCGRIWPDVRARRTLLLYGSRFVHLRPRVRGSGHSSQKHGGKIQHRPCLLRHRGRGCRQPVGQGLPAADRQWRAP